MSKYIISTLSRDFFSFLAKEDPDTKRAYDRRSPKKKALTNSPGKGRRARDVKASTTPSRAVLAPEDPAPGVGVHARLGEGGYCRSIELSGLDIATSNDHSSSS